ncbi:MAG TPA: hypothetical protein VJ841_01640 [Candidatus Saccharimonadales bacterium]|nr:hypothetical protein [Candidatus Saccharimonadales bacterium]
MERNESNGMGYIATGVEATSFSDGDELYLQMASEGIKSYSELTHDALQQAVEAPVKPEEPLFERIGQSPLENIQLVGAKEVELRRATALGEEPHGLKPLKSSNEFDIERFGLAA